ncbi:hypothetical protein Q8A73_006065 [Channa argus]|nr:hypothetical protein Q8A73_006065 [Channa argus]
MKDKLLVPAVVAIILIVGFTDSGQTPAPKPIGVNLNGKMVTFSKEDGISFFCPYFSAQSTVSPNSGVSVCLRYITDYQRTESPSLFTLSPSTTPLKVDVLHMNLYNLSRDTYSSQVLKPSIRFLSSGSETDIWTGVCLTVDSSRNLVQVFSRLDMSIRKFLPYPYVWSGEPVIDFSGFDGHLTDVQVWDRPLRYSEVYSYMTLSSYWSSIGSVLTWSNISYSIRGKTLLEDSYKWFDNIVYG